MVHLNQHLKQDEKSLRYAKGIWGAIKAYEGELNSISRDMITGPIRKLNDKFVMEHTAKIKDVCSEAGIILDRKFTCYEWFNMHRDLKSFYESTKVIHREHINGGVKSIADYLITNYNAFETPEDVLHYIVDNTHFVTRHVDEKELNEKTSLEKLQNSYL